MTLAPSTAAMEEMPKPLKSDPTAFPGSPALRLLPAVSAATPRPASPSREAPQADPVAGAARAGQVVAEVAEEEAAVAVAGQDPSYSAAEMEATAAMEQPAVVAARAAPAAMVDSPELGAAPSNCSPMDASPSAGNSPRAAPPDRQAPPALPVAMAPSPPSIKARAPWENPAAATWSNTAAPAAAAPMETPAAAAQTVVPAGPVAAEARRFRRHRQTLRLRRHYPRGYHQHLRRRFHP